MSGDHALTVGLARPNEGLSNSLREAMNLEAQGTTGDKIH
jgi:hypothetical protein